MMVYTAFSAMALCISGIVFFAVVEIVLALMANVWVVLTNGSGLDVLVLAFYSLDDAVLKFDLCLVGAACFVVAACTVVGIAAGAVRAVTTTVKKCSRNEWP